MKHRLFWKILIGFFITFIAIVQGLWLLFTFYDAGPRAHQMQLAENIAQSRPPPDLLFIPVELLALGVIGGLLFSAGLAWYVAQPIHRLRWGFDQLTKGNLDVRLQKTMGKRHDELADLARDFDQMSAHIKQLINSRNQLLHDVSHELRSPLARLNVAIALLQQNPTRMQELFERIESESQRLAQMVDELLTLSRVESGVPELDNYLDINNLIYAVIEDAKFEASMSGVIIHSNIQHMDDMKETSHVIKGNAQLLRRSLENVIRNAIHHSTSGKSVEVSLFSDTFAQCYIISISDRGCGVAKEKLSTIFDPFVRVHSNNSGEGFGLGLAIAYRAVLAHGGTIEAENRHEGGLVVTIKLPFDTDKPFIGS
jgi:two-component system OmpR family sensor kinase